ncbi:polysaccharide deacetylase family protein [Microtetraspora malaysiensis]|uniref:polysaccharide deacetylase family protein n=1 Tax=Microtetraspora malaysiensis TaxID=161358 RepID=UPI00082C6B19|nr:polysaccharide deacetylase family protein [Microtetraspora malaysiensis]
MHRYVDYSPIVSRPVLRWPDDKRLAVNVVVNVEHYEFVPPRNPHRDYFYRVPAAPDIVGYSFRDYGNRVGFWRMLEVLDRSPAKVTCSLNVETLNLFPEIRDAMVERDWCFMSHGTYNTRLLYGATAEEEREFYRYTMRTVRDLTGKELRGMLGPSFTATERTPELMAEAGMVYTMDWFIDDQPFEVKVPRGRLIGVPYSRELNDALLFPGYPMYAFEGDYFEQICRDQFDLLYRESAESGRVMTIALHPLYMGLPHQVGYLNNMLEYIGRYDDVWWTTPEAIADHMLQEGGWAA